MGKFKVIRLIHNTNMTIWIWIKFRDKSGIPFKKKNRQKHAINDVVTDQYTIK